MKFITTEPKHFYPYLMAKFYKKAVVASDSKSFKTKVYDTKFTISAQFLAVKLELSNNEVSVFTYFDGNPNIKRIHLNRWKKVEYTETFKLGSPRGSLAEVPEIMLDIINKIVIQDDSSKSELSNRKYRPMMALDGEVEANWADYIFSRLLDSVLPKQHDQDIKYLRE